VIEIKQLLFFTLILEKCLVRADHFAVFMQTLAHALAEADDAIDAIGRQE